MSAPAVVSSQARARAEALQWLLDNRCESLPRRDSKHERTLLSWTARDFRVSMPDRRGAILATLLDRCRCHNAFDLICVMALDGLLYGPMGCGEQR